MRKVVITDIDNTILDNSLRKRECLLEALRRPIPKELINRYGLPGITQEEMEAFFRIFLSGKYVHLDRPLERAAETLNWLVEKGIVLVYMSGRHSLGDESMERPTIEWLEGHGFPVPNGKNVRLVLQEKMIRERLRKWEYFQRIMHEVKSLGRPFCGLGDRPDDAENYLKAGFKPIVINTDSLPEKDFPSGSLIVKDWGQVRKWIEQNENGG